MSFHLVASFAACGLLLLALVFAAEALGAFGRLAIRRALHAAPRRVRAARGRWLAFLVLGVANATGAVALATVVWIEEAEEGWVGAGLGRRGAGPPIQESAMTEFNPETSAGEVSPAATIDPSGWLAQETACERLAAEQRPSNKDAVFAALAEAGIATVSVSFDGGGDSGQIESIEARDEAGEVALPEVTVEMVGTEWDGNGYVVGRRAVALAEAVETLAYGCLESVHGGWENNEGAYGEFTFDVASRTIQLVHNERFIETETFEHEW